MTMDGKDQCTSLAQLPSPSSATPRMPYDQAYAICEGYAAETVHGWGIGILGIFGSAIDVAPRRETVRNGCLAQYGW
jgi:hypothetical protein